MTGLSIGGRFHWCWKMDLRKTKRKVEVVRRRRTLKFMLDIVRSASCCVVSQFVSHGSVASGSHWSLPPWGKESTENHDENGGAGGWHLRSQTSESICSRFQNCRYIESIGLCPLVNGILSGTQNVYEGDEGQEVWFAGLFEVEDFGLSDAGIELGTQRTRPAQPCLRWRRGGSSRRQG